VQHGKNGWLFAKRSSESLNAAVEQFERLDWLSPQLIAQSAQQFSGAAYRASLRQQINSALQRREQEN